MKRRPRNTPKLRAQVDETAAFLRELWKWCEAYSRQHSLNTEEVNRALLGTSLLSWRQRGMPKAVWLQLCEDAWDNLPGPTPSNYLGEA